MTETAMATLNEIRSAFLSFFEDRDHVVVPSAPLVPQTDPTLLFVNAGMVPFKNVFTGLETPQAPRATSSQKCVRAGGKHNDLDNVGYTARHHTFFEMLGNFSFGDYFKDEAIAFAWDLVTKTFGLPKDKLLVTVYVDDEEAAAIWRKVTGFPDSQILRIAGSDNFWSMGDVGPCGPCSEIFFDHGPDIPGGPPGSPDEDGDRFVEIWNLVFMQYEQKAGGERVDLPKPSIDTGMGLERMGAVLQGVHSNYDTDLFRDLIAATAHAAENDAPEMAASRRVIADHLRAGAFLVADGVGPANEGRGYVLRRILRRAMRHAHLLGAKDPVLHRLAPTLIAKMGEAFPELRRAEALILETLRGEEERFRAMLERGLALLAEETSDLPEGAELSGDVAFKLYDTFGFPLDLTQDALRARGLTVDVAAFDAAMALQRETARANWVGSGAAADDGYWMKLRDRLGATRFLGYETEEADSEITAIAVDGEAADSAATGAQISFTVEATPFYAEAGGQVGDQGVASGPGVRVAIQDVTKVGGDVHIHHGEVLEGEIKVGAPVRLKVDKARRAGIRANHSATHLLHAALRERLGAHVAQKGSLVAPERLRFDFAHNAPLTTAERRAIEEDVNRVVLQNAPVSTREMAYDDAVAAGAMALFGEKYGDRVRVVAMGAQPAAPERDYSVELCGGTHVARTGDIGPFVLAQEGGVAAGVRRVEALTGAAARAHLDRRVGWGEEAADILKAPLEELPQRVRALAEERKALQRELVEAKKKLALGGGGDGAAPAFRVVQGVKVQAQAVEGVAGRDLRGLIDQAKESLGSGVAAFVSNNDGKAALAVGVTPDLVDRFDAVALVRIAVEAVGGKGGGGRPDFAQAGGPDGSKAQAAADAVVAAIESAAA